MSAAVSLDASRENVSKAQAELAEAERADDEERLGNSRLRFEELRSSLTLEARFATHAADIEEACDLAVRLGNIERRMCERERAFMTPVNEARQLAERLGVPLAGSGIVEHFPFAHVVCRARRAVEARLLERGFVIRDAALFFTACP